MFSSDSSWRDSQNVRSATIKRKVKSKNVSTIRAERRVKPELNALKVLAQSAAIEEELRIYRKRRVDSMFCPMLEIE